MKNQLYFGRVTQTYAKTNKLNESIGLLVRLYDRNLFTHEQFLAFKKDLVKMVERLNTEQPRCSPVKASFSTHDSGRTWCLSLGGKSIIEYTIYKVNQFYGEE
jgi:hypothetical protein